MTKRQLHHSLLSQQMQCRIYIWSA